MKNHMKLASLLLVISILMFTVVGCQTKKNSPAVASDVSSLDSNISSDIVSSEVSSSSNSSSEEASSSKSNAVSNPTSSTIPKAIVTNTQSTLSDIKSSQIQKENDRYNQAIKNINDTMDKLKQDEINSDGKSTDSGTIEHYKMQLASIELMRQQQTTNQNKIHQDNLKQIENQS